MPGSDLCRMYIVLVQKITYKAFEILMCNSILIDPLNLYASVNQADFSMQSQLSWFRPNFCICLFLSSNILCINSRVNKLFRILQRLLRNLRGHIRIPHGLLRILQRLHRVPNWSDYFSDLFVAIKCFEHFKHQINTLLDYM